MDKHKIKTGYNLVAKKYSSTRDQFNNQKYLEKLNQLLATNSTILDVGCGSGIPVDKFFEDKWHKIIGLDISEEQISLAKENVPSGKFEVKDMDNLSIGEYKVDAVVSFYAIFHIPRENHRKLLQNINSFLPKNGYLLITMGSTNWEGEEEFHGVQMQWSQYSSTENSKIVKEAGFEILLDEIDSTGNEKHQIIIAKKL